MTTLFNPTIMLLLLLLLQQGSGSDNTLEEYGWQYRGCFSGWNGITSPLHGKYSYQVPYQGSTMEGWGSAAVFATWEYYSGEYVALYPMSVERCLHFCKGHRYAGLEGGLGCMCGDVMKFETLQSDSECNLQCTDTTALQSSCTKYGCPAVCGLVQSCGGDMKISIYEATVFPNAGEFVACVPDNPRVLSDKNNYYEETHPQTIIDYSLNQADVNINSCMEYCRGYEYMGVNSGSFCTCGAGPDAIRGNPTALEPAFCNIPCSGGGLKSECAHFGCDNPQLTLGCNGDAQCCGGETGILTMYKIHACSVPSFPTPLYTTPTIAAFVGETIVFACEKGYILDPPDTTWLCNTSKQLEGGPAPTCRPYCAFSNRTIPLGHASTQETAISVGSTVSFECDKPELHQIQGESVIECLADGLWSHTAPECVAYCAFSNHTIPLGHASTQETAISVGSTVSFECDKPELHQIQGESVIECLADGLWSHAAPKCVAYCAFSNHTIPFGHASAKETVISVGSTVSFECDRPELHQIQGESVIECLADGLWSHAAPKCVAYCAFSNHTIPFGHASAKETVITVGSTVSFECDKPELHQIQGESVIECLADGLWSHTAPECVAYCAFSNHTIPLGHASTQETAISVGSTVSFECDKPELHQIQGESVIECLADGLWSHATPECVAYCAFSNHTIPLGHASTQETAISVGSTVSFECDRPELHQIQGESVIECLADGLWSYATPECVAYCAFSNHTIPFGHASAKETVISVGTTVSFECDKPELHQIQGESVIECLADGLWSHATPECVAYCAFSNHTIPFGHASAKETVISVGTTVSFECDKPELHQIQGESVIECLADGLWSHAAPKCVAYCAFSNHTIPLGHASTKETAISVGSTVSFECDKPELHQIQGESVIECLADGLWSHATPECVERIVQKTKSSVCDVYGYKNTRELVNKLCTDCEGYFGFVDLRRYGMKDSQCRANCKRLPINVFDCCWTRPDQGWRCTLHPPSPGDVPSIGYDNNG